MINAGIGERGSHKKPGSVGTSTSLDPAVRSVFASRNGRRLLIGTRGGELYEMSTADGSYAEGERYVGEIGPLTAGHGRGQVGYFAYWGSRIGFPLE